MKRRIVIVADIPEQIWENYQRGLFMITEQASLGRFGILSGKRRNVGQLAISVLQTEELIDRQNGETQ